MDRPDSRPAPSPEAATDEPASLLPPTPGGAPPAAHGDPPGFADFDPVPLRFRRDGLTPERQRAFVEALADTGIAREAAERVGLTEQSIARVRRRPDARAFDRACDAAQRFGARRLRSIAFERAIEGTVKRRYYRGELIGEERVFDNRLLIYLLGRTEHLLDPPEESRAVCDDWEAWMDAIERGLPEPARPAPLDPEAEAAAVAQLEDEFSEAIWNEDGVRWTGFPEPHDFDGEVEGEIGDPDYQRTLTQEEKAVLHAREAARLALCCADRDRFFRLPLRGSPGVPPPPSAEPYEPSGAASAVEPAAGSGISRGKTSSEGGSG